MWESSGGCELGDDIETHATIDKATIACGVFNNVEGRFCIAHDEEFVEKRYVFVQALEECSVKLFGINHLGFQIACKLDSIALNL